MEDYKARVSTKMRAAVDIILYHLSRDGLSPVQSNEVGGYDIPILLEVDDDDVKQETKVIMYMEFARMIPAMESVCNEP